MNKIREMDPLRSENWADLYADVPEEVNLSVQLAFSRIRRHEQRKRRLAHTLSIAACAVLAVGVVALSLNGGRGGDTPDHVAAPAAEITVLNADDVVYASNGDSNFHVYASCPQVGENAVSLQLVTAIEFDKELCPVCGANVQIEP